MTATNIQASRGGIRVSVPTATTTLVKGRFITPAGAYAGAGEHASLVSVDDYSTDGYIACQQGGECMVETAGVIAIDAELALAANGRVKTRETEDYCNGYARQAAGGAGEFILVNLEHGYSISADDALAAHIADTTGAHAASAISVLDTATRYTGADVETCLAEIAGAGRTTETIKANATAIAGHLSDTTDAHAASAVSVVTSAFAGVLSAADDTVQKALDTIDDHGHTAAAIPVVDAGNLYTETNIETVLAEIAGVGRTTETLKSISDHTGAASAAHAGSAIAVTSAGFTAALLALAPGPTTVQAVAVAMDAIADGTTIDATAVTGKLKIADGGVGVSKLGAGAVGVGLELNAGAARVAAPAAASGLGGGAGVSLVVNPDNSTIELTAVTGEVKVKDLGITTGKIALLAVDTPQLALLAVENAQIGLLAVDSPQIAAGAIDLGHMSADSVDSDQYVDGSIDLVHMSADSVDSPQYVDGSVDVIHLAVAAKPLVQIPFEVDLADIVGVQDIITDYLPGFAFEIVKFDAVVTKAVTTPAKDITCVLDIGANPVTGGSLQLAGTFTLGARQASTDITAANTGNAAAVLTIKCSVCTAAFVEGRASFHLTLRQTD